MTVEDREALADRIKSSTHGGYSPNPDEWQMIDAALRAPLVVKGKTIWPHTYSPDYQAMGDCRVCGHEQDKPWHSPPLVHCAHETD